jgi:hypothetical protein
MQPKQVFEPMLPRWIVSVLLIALLSACTTVPVKIKFPEAPEELLKSCPTLAQADPSNPRLSDLLTVVVDNYATYYDCKSVADGWQRWYQDQKRIFNEAMK